jgi:hypothetical protein
VFFTLRKNTIDRVEQEGCFEKDNCAASKKRINFRKLYKKKSQEVILGIFV